MPNNSELSKITNQSFQVLSVDSRKYQSTWQSIPHSHYFSEILYILEGKGNFIVHDQMYSIRRNNVILINPHVLHTEQSSDTLDLEYIVIGVEGLELVPTDEDFKILDTYSRINRIEDIMKGMLEETQRQEPHFEAYRNSLMQMLLVELQRFHVDSLSPVSTSFISQECSTVKRYIDANYADNLTLEFLADLVHWSKYYLAHQFSEAYGLSPIVYLREQRIENSKHLLSGHDLRISEIAISCGFSSQSYFAQTFKELTGITPSAYRKQAKSLPS